MYTADEAKEFALSWTSVPCKQGEVLPAVTLPHILRFTLRNRQRLAADSKLEAERRQYNNWSDVDFDHGASFYYTLTRAGPEYVVPADRLALAAYLCARSVKVRYVLSLLGDWVLKSKEKVILVFEYPMTQW